MTHVGQKLSYAFFAFLVFGLPLWALAEEDSIAALGKPSGDVTQLKPVPKELDSPPMAMPERQSPLQGDNILLDDLQRLTSPKIGEYWIGVQCTEILPPLRTHLSLEEKQGMLIEWVMPESPADQAGVEQYDVFLKLNDKMVGSLTDIVKIVEESQDKEIVVAAIRRGKPIELKIIPVKRPDNVRVTAPLRERMFRSVQPGVIIEGLKPGMPFEQLPPQDVPEEVQNMLERIQKQMEEQMRQLPETGSFHFEIPNDRSLERLFRFGSTPPNSNTVQIMIEPANEDRDASLTVRKNEQEWTVAKFSDLPEDVQKEVAEILKNTVDGQDVGDWIATQMADNRRVTFSVTTSNNVTGTTKTEEHSEIQSNPDAQ